MNEEQAKAWIKKLGDVSYERSDASDFAQAQGYLEAIEKAKVLEEALETIRCETFLDRIPAYNRKLTKEDMVKHADKILAQWEKEK